GASVQDGFMELGERRREFFEDDKGLQLLLAEIEKVLAELKKEDLPKGKKLQEWMAQIQQIEGNLTKGKKFAKELQEAVTKGAERIKALQAKNGEFREALISPAFQDERFNFAPLAKGEVIRFKVSRDAELKDGQLVPGKSNEIELRTAPVYSARFGTGVLFSDLDDPTFKFDRDNFLRFNEEGNGEVRLGLFVHNVWGRRSPLLKSTPFEKFVPTFSLGIPVVNSKAIFEEVLLGLNWELTSGIDLVVGAHFAKVNALRDDALLDVQVEVSEGVTLDVADFQKTTTDSALFFGIVVNSEIFKLFQNGGNGGS
ncbi:MAG: hypothetical protein KDD47_04290, partial [Acidobacteria bacterium]|nr:hypothetical protein [Acidobacteriota bacterium]